MVRVWSLTKTTYGTQRIVEKPHGQGPDRGVVAQNASVVLQKIHVAGMMAGQNECSKEDPEETRSKSRSDTDEC